MSGSMSKRSLFHGWRLALRALAVCLLLAAGAFFVSCSEEQSGKRSDEDGSVGKPSKLGNSDGVRAVGPSSVSLPGGVKLEMVRIPAGAFTMGSPADEPGRSDDEKPHRVTITKAFWLGKYEVTQEQWEAVMGNNPSDFRNGGNYPVEMVSWDDAMAFCRKLNDAGLAPSGWRFDLPTEAQWEYACRAGTRTALNNGRDFTNLDGEDAALDEVGWYFENSGWSTHPVGRKKPNAWGLHDMHGNVCEWCSDWYGAYGGDATDPAGPRSGQNRVHRGGGWSDFLACFCRAAYRHRLTPSRRASYLGFRLALVRVQ